MARRAPALSSPCVLCRSFARSREFAFSAAHYRLATVRGDRLRVGGHHGTTDRADAGARLDALASLRLHGRGRGFAGLWRGRHGAFPRTGSARQILVVAATAPTARFNPRD